MHRRLVQAPRIRAVIVMMIAMVVMTGCNNVDPRFVGLYLDLDGTTLGPDGHVRPATLAALREYRESGGRFGIATGRTKEQALEILAMVEPDLPTVLSNGSVIVDPRTARVLALHTLAFETVMSVLGNLTARDSVLGVIVHYERVAVPDRNSPGLEAFAKGARIHLSATLTPGADVADTTGKGALLKLLVVVAPPEHPSNRDCPCDADAHGLADRIRDELAPITGTTAHVVASGEQTIEITPTTKGAAVLEALGFAGIDPKDAAAIGDSGNDIEMLREVGLGVAMGNCRSGACEAALVRIGRNDTDAIADLIRHALVRSGSKRR